jgi:hypothetical protein
VDVSCIRFFALFEAGQYVNQGQVVITDTEFTTVYKFSASLNPNKIVYNAN